MKQAIGVFDSGVGGLSVLKEIHRLLPEEDLIYVADSAYAPYGDKSAEFIQQRSLEITQFLVEQGCKAIVVACNTATSYAVESLRQHFTIPIVGMEPAIKPALTHQESSVIGVIATQGTINSPRFSKLLGRFQTGKTILSQPCPGLVEKVEANLIHADETRSLINEFLGPLMEKGMDTLVLGCTHYPFLIPVIEKVVGENKVLIIDPSPAIARELRRRLEEIGQLHLATDASQGRLLFWSSDDTEHLRILTRALLNRTVEVKQLTTTVAAVSS